MLYPITLTPDDDTLLATCPDLPEVTSFGSDREKAVRHAADAVEEALVGRLSDSQDIPHPSAGKPSVPVALPLAIKIEPLRALHDARASRADLARRLAWRRAQVDCLFDPNHASRLDQLEAAFVALGWRVEVRVVGGLGLC